MFNAGLLSALGLALALTGHMAQPRAQDNPVVMSVGEHEVTRAEFEQMYLTALRLLAAQQDMAWSSLSPDQIRGLKAQFLGQRAGELALALAARKRGIEADSAVVDEQLASFSEKISADASNPEPVDRERLRQLLEDKQLALELSNQLRAEIVVRPGDVVTMHHDLEDQLRLPEQVCFRHIVVEDEATALAIRDELGNGADFAALAAARSRDTSTADKGGDAGCYPKQDHAAGEFERATFTATVGELTGPVKSTMGYHLLVVYEHKPARKPTLNEVFADLENEIRNEKLPEKLMEIRDNAGIVTYPDRLQD